MKKLPMICLVALFIYLTPLSAQAGRTAAGYGGEYCQCGQSNGPCYDEQGNRCDFTPGGRPSIDKPKNETPSGTTDWGSLLLYTSPAIALLLKKLFGG